MVALGSQPTSHDTRMARIYELQFVKGNNACTWFCCPKMHDLFPCDGGEMSCEQAEKGDDWRGSAGQLR